MSNLEFNSNLEFDYDELRKMLVRYSRIKGFSQEDAEDIASETISRVIERVNKDTEYKIEEPVAYFVMTARHLMSSKWRSKKTNPRMESLEGVEVVQSEGNNILDDLVENEKSEQYKACMEKCLDTLSSESRQIIVEYYQNPRVKREQLAIKFDISVSTLRVKVYRIKERLQQCLKSCLEKNR
ncbi:MAG: sigma-70 family RNA polymerase sigma factor [Pyrinomonadaceae bacterium]